MSECEMCQVFNSRFGQLRPNVKEYRVSKHIFHDIENHEEIIEKILSCEHLCSSELHKFEKKVGDFSIFRAKINGKHIVYALDGKKILFFLRAFDNFTSYTRFLDNNNEIKRDILSLNS
ncbi:MAG: hypothetical protein Q8P15_00410 [Nanoarchaeota archaeon]|nr:hypothetical protein [Nanoarchaeota archaeon]